MIFESHAHYDDDAYDSDRAELLDSMGINGIEYVINVGASIQSIDATLALMEEYPFIYGALGVHPSKTAELTEENFGWIKERCLEGHIKNRGRKVVAVGEIGLDYYWPEPGRSIQQEWFERQLILAKEVKLPAIIHSRDAAKDTVDTMKNLLAGDIGGVVHCFSYTKEVAREFLNMDFFIGIGGVVTFSNAKKLKEAVSYIPIQKILLETDSPYLSPVPYRGKRNSSLNIPFIAKEIAQIKGLSYEEVIEVTSENARALFGVGGSRASAI